MEKGLDLQGLKSSIANESVPKRGKAVVHLTYDNGYGAYHVLVSALPLTAPFLPQLRNGEMLAFFHTGQALVAPVLSFLGVAQSAFFPPAEPPLAQPYHFCAPRLHFELGTRPQYPRAHFVQSHLRDLRRALEPPPNRPCVPKPQGIVVLARGNSSHAPSNEAAMATALGGLGRAVTVLDVEATPFPRLLEVLGSAAVLVSAHGTQLANMVFAPEGAKVVEVVPQMVFGVLDFHFRDLAGSLNFTYVPFGQEVKVEGQHLQLSRDLERLRDQVASLL
uniref:Glycosyltransferase 61 catalytic domain-containing protein n=1 Tax=Alexandrium catenella TaxID=2925 RepID=A0A7S1WB93_ALECA